MSLPIEELQKVAHLARLNITDEQAVAFSADFTGILKLVNQMSEIDTRGINPMAHPFSINQRVRPDEITETDQRETFQTCAPNTEHGLYLVPKVIE